MIRAGISPFDLINDRAENIETMDNLERTSLDYYATVRSIYRQNRNSEISNNRELDDAPDFDFDMDDPFDLGDDEDFDAEDEFYNLDEDQDMFELGDDEGMFGESS